MSGRDGYHLYPVYGENGNHFFRTVTDGSDITKTPEEMFDSAEIENNLKLVDDTIRKFYGWEEEGGQET